MKCFNLFKKKKENKDQERISKYIYSIDEMKAYEYIQSSRDYLNYIEEHLINVAKAFSELSDACAGKEFWVGDDFHWWTLHNEVLQHDLSKLSKEEFVQYRDNFFPVCDGDKDNSGFDLAWENHKKKNHHHHETASSIFDIVHMIIDWIAMSYKFKDDPRKFYEKTKPNMGENFTPEHHEFISKQFDHLEEYRK